MYRRDNLTRSELDQLRLRALGRRIRQRRRALEPQVTQDDLATRAGVSRTELSRIENGTAHPTVTMIHHLADALGCHITDLFGDDDNPE
jgi:transcriptional regulator with XRE-family HTH domain